MNRITKVYLCSLVFFISFFGCEQTTVNNQKSVTQRGFTWTFDKEYECGQFINGDWWVIGPVVVTNISPEKRVASNNEYNLTGKNHWGDAGLQMDKSVRNGSVVVDILRGTKQGFDSRGKGFDSSLTLALPYSFATNTSIVSSQSNDTIPSKVMYHELMWDPEDKQKSAISTVSILTCLSEAPPKDAFRPSYVGLEKKIFRFTDIDIDKLLDLEPTPSMPSWSQFERYFERPWLNHFNGSWLGQELMPTQMNQVFYGREYTRVVSLATLMLNTEATDEQKKKLLIGVLQLGIDIRGIAEIGGTWIQGGGLTSGRKWPVIFAYLMFEDPYFKDMPSTANFHEDVETYYGKGWAGQAALWQIGIHHGVRKTYMEQTPDNWGSWDMQDGNAWGISSEDYRLCCNSVAWLGESLSALMMEGKSAWNHNAFFDNVEDWMRVKDLYVENRGEDFPRPCREGILGEEGTDDFMHEMWWRYRSRIPEQANGEDNKKWDPSQNLWMENEILNIIEPQSVRPGESKEIKISTILASSNVNQSVLIINAPSFVEIKDRNNGTGSILISPSTADKGKYEIKVQAISASFTTSEQQFELLVK